jgi:hypothetical protein
MIQHNAEIPRRSHGGRNLVSAKPRQSKTLFNSNSQKSDLGS